MKGYKGFSPGLICRGKQYAENTVFEEDSAVICSSGMHFCENPFDVLDYYPFVNNSELNEFAEVEALDEVKTDDNKKHCTKKLRIGAKIGIAGLVSAFVDFTLSKLDRSTEAAINKDDRSAAINTGDLSAAINKGDRSAAINTGNYSAATVEGQNSFAIATGIKGKARGKRGCYIAIAEWVLVDGERKIKAFKTAKVDGKRIKEDTFYTLKDGKFVEAD